jgi:prepilin-type N-terminal cleavage/methylation domain-containing protein
MKLFKKSAFTLIELLTVIAIIGVLAAILVPTVAKVRLSASDTAGLSNIRQLGMAYLLAAQGNKGILSGIHYDSLSERWDRAANAVLTNSAAEDYPTVWSDAMFDPSAVARGVIDDDNEAKWHFAPIAAITRGTGSSSGSGAAPNALQPYNRLMKHKHPDRQILLADAGLNDPDDSGIWGDLLHGESWSWSGSYSGNYDASTADDPIDPGLNIGGDIRWMDGSAKFFFLDGHVERRQEEEVLNKNLNPLYP